MTLSKNKILGDYDEFDLLILRELRENGKISIRELSHQIGLHPNTLIQRVKRLEDNKTIVKYSAEIDYSKLGYDLHVLLFMKVDKKTRSDWEVLTKLRAIKPILALYAITGDFDVLAILKVKDRGHLMAVTKEINKNDFILETHTNLVLYPFKHAYEFNPF